MTCYMFPGQPVALGGTPGADAEFIDICNRCGEISGFNPRDSFCIPGMAESVRLQLFGVCASLARQSQLLREGGSPSVITEHSMGIYPALAACGSVDSSTALELAWRIGTCISEMGKQCEYALGSVIGISLDPLVSITGNNGTHIANFNTSRHFLLAGEKNRILATLVEAEACGAFSASSFPCDAPLHTVLIRNVASQLEGIVADYSFKEPAIPLIESFHQTALSAEAVPRFLVNELCCPVFWERTYRFLLARGVSKFIEVGTGVSLTKFNRWIDSES